jgi:hypothetical protein
MLPSGASLRLLAGRGGHYRAFGTGFLATTTGWVIGFCGGPAGAVLSYLFYMLGVGLWQPPLAGRWARA